MRDAGEIERGDRRRAIGLSSFVSALCRIACGARPQSRSSSELVALFPDAPTLGELGYTDPMIRSYLALVVPSGTPEPIIAKLYVDVADIIKEPGFAKRQIVDRGLEPVVDTPDMFARFLLGDRTRTAEAVKAAGVEPQ